MRFRVPSLLLAGLTVLAVTGSSAGAQAIRTDTIVGFAQTAGAPQVPEGTFQPTVQALSPTAAAGGDLCVSYVADLSAWFATIMGWRPSEPVAFLLFSEAEEMVNAAQSLAGFPASPRLILDRPAYLTQVSRPSFGLQEGSWAILVNTDTDFAADIAAQLRATYAVETGLLPVTDLAPDAGLMLIQNSMARQFAVLMELDVVGTAGPTFYREGLANSIAFRIVPGTPPESGQPRVVAHFQTTNEKSLDLSSSKRRSLRFRWER